MTTRMRREIDEAPERVAAQLVEAGPLYREIGAELRALSPAFLATGARGSSDHAATYLKYLSELRLGVPVASLGPSVASVYGAPLRMAGGAFVAVSQSGASPDLVALQAAARAGGAFSVALVNTVPSPLSEGAGRLAPLLAGEEKAVAATKTVIATLAAMAAISAAWAGDDALDEAVAALPEGLSQAIRADWSAALEPLAAASSVYVVGRGPGLASAGEAALKLKETAELHAESYSAAELMHGPIQLAGPGLVGLVLAGRDAARPSLDGGTHALRAAGARAFLAAPDGEGVDRLDAVPARHPLLDPILLLASFYGLAEAVARARGLDPDAPALLSKVTRTR